MISHSILGQFAWFLVCFYQKRCGCVRLVKTGQNWLFFNQFFAGFAIKNA